MIISVRKWVERFKFILMFVVMTYVLYHMLAVISAWLEPSNKYKTPLGGAVKVFDQHTEGMGPVDMSERLKEFYRFGE